MKLLENISIRFRWLISDIERQMQKPLRNRRLFTKEQYDGLYEFFREYELRSKKSYEYTKKMYSGEDICIHGIHIEYYHGCLSLTKDVKYKPNRYYFLTSPQWWQGNSANRNMRILQAQQWIYT